METIMDGVNLMILGMGSVFLFLIIMVVIIVVMAKILAPYAHVLEPVTPQARPQKKKAVGNKLDTNLVSAIMAAVQIHKDKK